MNERPAVISHEPISRQYTAADDTLRGYDTLQDSRFEAINQKYPGFAPNPYYSAYMNMHKVFVGRSGGVELTTIAENLENEWLPDYLNAGGWAAAEAGLVRDELPSAERMALLDLAERCWEKALRHQTSLSNETEREYLVESTDEFRLALNLAFSPLMKSIIAGNATRKVREAVFSDTLAIAQVSAVQLDLAHREGNIDAVGDHLGFGHECNALLALLYVNDPNYLPIPSTYRAGSGYEYRSQTHDITVINQHWGEIHRVLPAEIKAAASLRDRQRYKALIVRGKMHLTIPGKYQPYDTTESFAQCFEGDPSEEHIKTVQYTTSTIRNLLALYQKGDCPEEFKRIRSQTRFHNMDKVVAEYKELSPYKLMN